MLNNFFLFSNFVANFRKAYMMHHKDFICRYNKWLLIIIKTFLENNFILSYRILDDSYVKIILKYYLNTQRPLFTNLKLISSSSHIKHLKYKHIKFFLKNYDLLLLSTSSGLFFLNRKSLNKYSKEKKGGILLLGIKF